MKDKAHREEIQRGVKLQRNTYMSFIIYTPEEFSLLTKEELSGGKFARQYIETFITFFLYI